MFYAEDLPLWAYILTVAIGSAVFLHRQRQASEDLQRQLRAMESRLHARIDELERELQPDPRPKFRLIRSPDPQA